MSSRFILQQAAHCFNQGGILAYPTESVYGLGCDPLNLSAVENLLSIKNRAVEKGLILVTDHIDKISPYIHIDSMQLQQLQQTTRPTTWLIKASELTPAWVKGKHKKVAIRITRHPIALALCQQLTRPIISTSANPSQRTPAKNSLQIHQYFQQTIDFIVPGNIGKLEKPTQIIDMESQRIIRQ